MSKYTFGMHDLCPKNILDGKGSLVVAFALGHDPDNHSSVDLSHRPETILCRLNHGWAPDGTLPLQEFYTPYLARVRNFVAGSSGIRHWIVGNEFNHSQERPFGAPIIPEYAAQAYKDIRALIRALPGHENDKVLTGAIAPWNIETGDWLGYAREMFALLDEKEVDGITLHAYTHGTDPGLITSLEMRHGWLWHFRTYQQQIDNLPSRFFGLPFYITEANQGGVWLDANTGWVQNAYLEIDNWNKEQNPQIHSLVLYRWEFDQWKIHDKPGVVGDLHAAMEHGYTWTDGTIDPPDPPEETMLKNPSFEDGWYEQGAGELVLPDHWTVEFQEGNDPFKRPEIKPNPEYVTDGKFSIRAFPPAHSRSYFGIYQEIDATPGQWYRFSADVRVESKPPGELAAFVGIQPWGSGLFERQMIWGKETQTQLEWQRVEVFAQAFGGSIRVVMGATNKWATQNNTVWWDNAKLEIWECTGEPPVDPPDPDPPDPPGECSALTYEQTVAAVKEGTRSILIGMCSSLAG